MPFPKMKITKIDNEDIYFSIGKKLWILHYQGLEANGYDFNLSTEDCIKVGNAMGEYGYGDADVNWEREELRFESNVDRLFTDI